jgi:hypothetical protein
MSGFDSRRPLQQFDFLELDHLKVIFSRAAFWASPIRRNIGPCGARRNSIFWATSCLIVNPTANIAYPSFHDY